jgi:hypothetical protein
VAVIEVRSFDLRRWPAMTERVALGILKVSTPISPAEKIPESTTGCEFGPGKISLDLTVTWQSLAHTNRKEIRFPIFSLPAGQYWTRLS